MDTSIKLRELSDVTAYQWGIVTSAQAAKIGVTRLDLSRLADKGLLVRLAHGIYRDAGTPESEFDELRAAWLSSDPGTRAENRMANSPTSVIVANESAAMLHRIGDFRADVHEFVSPVRRQSQRREIRYRQRELEDRDVTIVAGLPVMTVERTIADLIEDHADHSLVADALRDASEKTQLNEARLAELLSPLSARNGFGRTAGNAFVAHLKQIAGIDDESIASQIAAEAPLGALVASKYFEQLVSLDLSWTAVLNANAGGLLESVKDSIAARLEQVLESQSSWREQIAGRSPAEAGLGSDVIGQIVEEMASRIVDADFINSISKGWSDVLVKSAYDSPSRGDRLFGLADEEIV